MDLNQEFTQALLEQLRRDLRRFAPGRMVEVERMIGRSPQYLRKADARHLKLVDYFAAGEELGFLPGEWFGRAYPTGSIPRMPFVLKRLQNNHEGRKGSRLVNLVPFLDWAGDISIQAEGSIPRLSSLQPAKDALSYLDDWLELHASLPAFMASSECTNMIAMLSGLLVEASASEEAPLRELFALLGSGFWLEHELEDWELRSRLYETCGHLFKVEKNNLEGAWSFHEAARAALLISRFERARRLHLHATEMILEEPMEPVQRLLTLMEQDRRRSELPKGAIDHALGAKRAFATARRRKDLSVDRWIRFLNTLSIPPTTYVLGLKACDIDTDSTIHGLESLVQGLGRKTTGMEFPWMSDLIDWARHTEYEPELSETLTDLSSTIGLADWSVAFPQLVDRARLISETRPTVLAVNSSCLLR